MTHYKHTQIGTVLLVTMTFVFFVSMVVVREVGPHPFLLVVLAFLLFLTVLFATLTVEVTNEAVRIRFGPGPIRKGFPLSEIRSARAVRNHWAYGWGIRMTPHGWLFNVSGLDAVELEMHDGKRYRIGTDQPRELLAAIEQARG
jgi:hypothetical protein